MEEKNEVLKKLSLNWDSMSEANRAYMQGVVDGMIAMKGANNGTDQNPDACIQGAGQ